MTTTTPPTRLPPRPSAPLSKDRHNDRAAPISESLDDLDIEAEEDDEKNSELLKQGEDCRKRIMAGQWRGPFNNWPTPSNGHAVGAKAAEATPPNEAGPPKDQTADGKPAAGVPRQTPAAKPPNPPMQQPALDPIAAQREGYIVRTMSAGVTIGTIAGQHFGGQISMVGAQAYRDDLIARAGAPADPLEEMLVEQFALLNSQLHLTHRKAAAATSHEVTKILCGTVARLSSESRRMALVIRTYRSGQPKPSVVVNQSGNGSGNQVAVVVQERGRKKDSLRKDNKVGSKPKARRGSSQSTAKPKTRCCR